MKPAYQQHVDQVCGGGGEYQLLLELLPTLNYCIKGVFDIVWIANLQQLEFVPSPFSPHLPYLYRRE